MNYKDKILLKLGLVTIKRADLCVRGYAYANAQRFEAYTMEVMGPMADGAYNSEAKAASEVFISSVTNGDNDTYWDEDKEEFYGYKTS